MDQSAFDPTTQANRLHFQKILTLLNARLDRAFTVAEVADRVAGCSDETAAQLLAELLKRKLVQAVGEQYASLNHVPPLAEASEEGGTTRGAVFDLFVAKPGMVFDADEVVRITGKTLSTVNQSLAYYSRVGKLERVKRGRYRLAQAKLADKPAATESARRAREHDTGRMIFQVINADSSRDFGLDEIERLIRERGIEPRGTATKLAAAAQAGLIQRTARGRYAALRFERGVRGGGNAEAQAPAAAVAPVAPTPAAQLQKPKDPLAGVSMVDALTRLATKRDSLRSQLEQVERAIEVLEAING